MNTPRVKRKSFLRDHPLFSIQRIIQIQMKHLRHNLNIEHRFHLKRYHAKTLMGHGKIWSPFASRFFCAQHLLLFVSGLWILCHSVLITLGVIIKQFVSINLFSIVLTAERWGFEMDWIVQVIIENKISFRNGYFWK